MLKRLTELVVGYSEWWALFGPSLLLLAQYLEAYLLKRYLGDGVSGSIVSSYPHRLAEFSDEVCSVFSSIGCSRSTSLSSVSSKPEHQNLFPPGYQRNGLDWYHNYRRGNNNVPAWPSIWWTRILGFAKSHRTPCLWSAGFYNILHYPVYRFEVPNHAVPYLFTEIKSWCSCGLFLRCLCL